MHTHDLAASSFAHARVFIDDAALSPCPASVGPAKTSMKTTATTTTNQCLLARGTKTGFAFSASSMPTCPQVVTEETITLSSSDPKHEG